MRHVLGCEFDKFLHAAIGDDNGMPLTVLSALARSDVDPWEEAAKLSQLPKNSAVAQLASRLGALRQGSLLCPDPAGIAASLIALLPHPRELASTGTPAKHAMAVSILAPLLTYLLFMLLSSWLLGNMQAPRQTDSPVAAVTAATAVPTP